MHKQMLLDENFPSDFAKEFSDYHIHTVHSLGCASIKNGELMRRAAGVCEVFITLDKNLEYQQNIKILTFGVVVVHAISNRMVHLKPLVANTIDAASKVTTGTVEHVSARS
jgi:hypothetical protein